MDPLQLVYVDLNVLRSRQSLVEMIEQLVLDDLLFFLDVHDFLFKVYIGLLRDNICSGRIPAQRRMLLRISVATK